ncbi:MAG TPA: VanZ family protein [Lachnospiraceae bacterium]|nr:VanZ family protein [Lachnospiraceae bacterium]
MTFKKKLVTTVILGLLLVLLYRIIFQFSAQNGETSSILSKGITKGIVTFIRHLSGGHMSEQNAQGLSSSGELILRKAAHFTEYAIMGILTMGILNCYMQKRKAYLFAVIWVLLSAVLDEWHQYDIPGRCASVYDVMIDTLGGMAGAAFCIFFIWMIEQKKIRQNPG